MGIRKPGWSRVGFRRAGTNTVGGGTINSIASAAGSITVTGGGGPATNLEVTFGGAPPAIASAGAAGVANTSARSDHTHALDLPAYNPSVAGMQASGVIQQTYAAPTATPAVLNVGVGLVPFGNTGGSGVLVTDTKMRYAAGATWGLAIGDTNAVPTPAAPFLFGAMFTAIIESFTDAFDAQMSRNTTAGINFVFSKSRGTHFAPTSILAGDTILNFELNPVTTGAPSSVVPIAITGFVPTDAVVAAGSVPMIMGFQGGGPAGGGGNINTATPNAQLVVAADSQGNAYTGWSGLTQITTDGFLYMPATTAGIPLNAPNQLLGSTRAGQRTPTLIDSANRRFFGYISGAWHFSTFDDYAPTATRIPFGGAAANTLTDDANLTYTTATRRLTVGTSGAGNGGSIVVNSGSDGVGVLPGGGTVAINVPDTHAGGAAHIAVDDGFFGQSLVGYTAGTFTGLTIGCATGQVLGLQWNMTLSGAGVVGAGNSALQVSGTTGQTVIGDSIIGALYAINVSVRNGAAAADVFLGNAALAVADTHGFPYMPNVAYASTGPAGNPNAFTGKGAAYTYDNANNRIWVRDTVNAKWVPFIGFATTAAAGAQAMTINNGPAAATSTVAKWEVFRDAGGVLSYRPFWQ